MEENMGYASESNPCSSRCLGMKPKKLKQRLSDIGIIFCKDPPKCSWGLGSLVDTASKNLTTNLRPIQFVTPT